MGLLLIDAGNSRIKWTFSEVPALGFASAPPNWQHVGTAQHTEIADLLAPWRDLPVTRVLISNVAGTEIGSRLQETLRLAFDGVILPEWFASVQQLAGVFNAYRNPVQLGCDRFASAIGARSLYPQQALLLATCGTATTIDVIHADGTFIGGMILPGLGLMANALAHGTAQLPLILDHVEITAPFANNTVDAIISGCIAAQVGAISTALTLQRRQHPEMEIKCILTGGSAGVIAPYLSTPYEKVDHLVLTGLWASIAAETER